VTGNALYYGDNLEVLRESITTESVDLVYLDPPFNSQATYNLLFRSPAGAGSQAQIEAFEDTWHWGTEAESAFDRVLRSGNTDASDLLLAMRSFLEENDMMAYLAMMAARLIELHRVLKRTGTIYLHCDPAASHYLKLLLDAIFGKGNFLSEVIWKRTGTHSSAKRWGPVHDVILVYAVENGRHKWNRLYVPYSAKHLESHYRKKDEKGRRYEHGELTGPGTRKGRSGESWKGFDVTGIGRHWTTTVEKLEELYTEGLIYLPEDGGWPRRIRFEDESKGRALGDVWEDIPPVNMRAAERLGYPTQKPVTLLERIIAASSDEGDNVLDPFCGCGTTIHAAQKLNRAWTGIDVTHLAISLIERRLKDAFPGIAFDVHGTPTDLDGARDLALRDKYQFQWWAVSLIEAQPYGGKKKGADGGIDGLIYFRSDAKTTERAVVSVKGGGVSVPMVRDLKGVLDREKAPIGVFLTLEAPTRPMAKEAASAGFYTLGDRQYPRIQIITIEQALRGAKPAIPLIDTGAAFKRAPREGRGDQIKLDF
jgi:adenine specific DNA methylase Mod